MSKETKISIPEPVKLIKFQKSDNNNEKESSITIIIPPFQGLSAIRFEHVLRKGPKAEKRSLRYLGGGVGIVKKGFRIATQEPEDPVWAIKIMEDKKLAENEAKYNKILRREVAWGSRNGKYYVITPWIKGVTLEEYCQQLNAFVNQKKSMTYPYLSIPKRILLFIGYLQQVKILCNLGLLIGDPKSSNAMLDFVNNILLLIDLDAVHKPGNIDWAFTRIFLPPELIGLSSKEEIKNKYSESSDIFIFGHMLAELMPEFFTVTFDSSRKKAASLDCSKGVKRTCTRRLLLQAVRSMMDESSFERPTLEACIEFLEMAARQSEIDFASKPIKSKLHEDKDISTTGSRTTYGIFQPPSEKRPPSNLSFKVC